MAKVYLKLAAIGLICAVTLPLTNCAVGLYTPLPQQNPLPFLISLSPERVTAGGAAFTLTVNGTRFISGSVVRWKGADRTTTFVSSTQVRASISAADIATAGTAAVTVFTPTPGGGTSNNLNFTISPSGNPVPTVTSLVPASATVGGAAFSLTVNGTNFINGSVVRWGGSDRTTTYVSGAQLTASITAADIATTGLVAVTVFNPAPDGGTSNSLDFTIENPVPTLTLLSPSSATAGAPAFTLTVTGTNFVIGSVVRWGGSNRSTTYVNSTQVTASITAGDIATAGTVAVTVFNPAPGGGTSDALTFTNNPSAAAAVSVFAGSGQSATINTAFGTALQAKVTDASNNPLSGVTVTFQAPGSSASGTFANGLTSTTASSNASGIATATTFTANSIAGSYNVTASVVGVGTPATFALTNNPGAAAAVSVFAGSPQSATINTAFATALQAKVTDASNNPLSGVTVTFQAPASSASGTFANGQTSTTASTNASGIATATTFTANSIAGSYNVTATVVGVGTPATFALTNNAAAVVSILTTRLPDTTGGKSYSFTLAASGGTPPYSWSISAGGLPSGLGLSSGGDITGIAAVVGVDTTANFTAHVSDSAGSPNTQTQALSILVRAAALGRNDTCSASTATKISNGVVRASISPYGDVDVYTFQGTGGSHVTIEIVAQNLDIYGDGVPDRDVYLDSFLELLDSSCTRLTYDDDIDPGVIQDSKISVSSSPFPGACPGSPCVDFPPPTTLPYTGTYYIRVSDLRGDGHPDFIYELHLSGAD
jgi:hypothetical protein